MIIRSWEGVSRSRPFNFGARRKIEPNGEIILIPHFHKKVNPPARPMELRQNCPERGEKSNRGRRTEK